LGFVDYLSPQCKLLVITIDHNISSCRVAAQGKLGAGTKHTQVGNNIAKIILDVRAAVIITTHCSELFLPAHMQDESPQDPTDSPIPLSLLEPSVCPSSMPGNLRHLDFRW